MNKICKILDDIVMNDKVIGTFMVIFGLYMTIAAIRGAMQ